MQGSGECVGAQVQRIRAGIPEAVSPADCRPREALVRGRNTLRKHAWPAEIVLIATAGAGAVEIVRRTGKSKTCVWRWQERFAVEGVRGLLCDRTSPSSILPLRP